MPSHAASAAPERSRAERFVLSTSAKVASLTAGAVAGGLGSWATRWIVESPHQTPIQGIWLGIAGTLAVFTIVRETWAEKLKRSREADLDEALREAHAETDALQHELEQRQSTARIEAYKSVLDPLSGLHQAVGALLEEEDYQRGLLQFRIAVVDCIAHLMPEPGHRACYYSADETDGTDEAAGHAEHRKLDANSVLVLAAFRGRADEPRPSFNGDNSDGKNPHGAKFLSIALSHGGPECFSAIDPDDETIRPSPNAVYQSFMVVPVRKGLHTFGALSIDCQNHVDYDERHKKIGASLALLLAMAEHRATKRSFKRGANLALTLAREQIKRELRQIGADTPDAPGAIDDGGER